MLDSSSVSRPPTPITSRPPTPIVLGGLRVKVVTGCGNMYVVLTWYQGRLYEVFATIGKGGGCAVCQTEGLTRSTTLGLKHGIPVADFVRQFRGIQCPWPRPFPKDTAVMSCPDGIAKTLERYGSLDIEDVIALIRQPNGDGTALPGKDLSEEEEMAEAVKSAQELEKARMEQGL